MMTLMRVTKGKREEEGALKLTTDSVRRVREARVSVVEPRLCPAVEPRGVTRHMDILEFSLPLVEPLHTRFTARYLSYNGRITSLSA